MKENKLTVVGDSLSAVRKENTEEILIWPELVAKDLNLSLSNLSRPFLTSNVLKKTKITEATIVLNIGLVDCAERRYSRLETKVMAKLPNKVSKFLKKKLKRTPSLTRSYVKIEQFCTNIEAFLLSRLNCKILILGILPSSNNSILSNVTKKQIEIYNRELSRLALKFNQSYEDTTDLVATKYYLEDGYHLSKYGHQVVSKKVLAWLNSEK